MKQLLFMLALTLAGTVGTIVFNPFWGVAVYYLFAVLRPQYMWEWALATYVSATFPWSFYVAVCTILAAVFEKLGLMAKPLEKGIYAESNRLAPTHYGLCLFAFWTLVSYVCAHDQRPAWDCLYEYLKIFTMFLVSVYLIRSVHQLWTLLVLAALALGYIAYEVNLLYLQIRKITILESGFGGLDNNGAGLMLAMGVPLCLFVWEGTTRWWRWAFAAFVPSLVHAVFMSYSRGAMLALLLATPLCYLRSHYKRYMTLAFIGMAFIVPIMAGNEIRARFFSVGQFEKDDSANSRFKSWKAAYLIASENPFVGVGLRNSNLFSKQYGADLEGRTIHSQYLQVAADMGFVGLALYGLMLGSIWISLRRSRRILAFREDPEAQQARAIASAVECSMAVFCIGAVFLSLEVFELPYLLLLLGAELGILLDPRMKNA